MKDIKSKRKYLGILARDAAFCACLMYVIFQGIQLIPINAEWFKPAGNAFEGFDWSDIYFSKIKTLNNSNVQNQQIIAVNIDKANRQEIANTLLKLNKAGPKVIGLDILFNKAMDSTTDALLDSAIRSYGKKIVVACYADSTLGNNIYSFEPFALPKLGDQDNMGYVNFIGEEQETVRNFYKVQDFRDRKVASFAFSTFIKSRDSGDLKAFKEKLSGDESIIPYQSIQEHYTTFTYQEILDSAISFNILKDKIILIGFCGSTDGATVIDDKHFTPLNENYAGKSLPDMFGIYIQANIIEAYLEDYIIYTPNRPIQIIVCLLFIWLFLMLYMYSESKEHFWRKIVEIALQLFFGFIIIILAIYFLSSYGIKWNIGEMIAAVALAEPMVGAYKVIIHYINKVYTINSIFPNEE